MVLSQCSFRVTLTVLDHDFTISGFDKMLIELEDEVLVIVHTLSLHMCSFLLLGPYRTCSDQVRHVTSV